MHVLGLIHIPQRLQEEVIAALETRGRTGVIRYLENSVRTSIGDEWTLETDEASLEEIVELLAPRCAYAVVIGSEARFGPTLELADGDIQSDLFDSAQSPDGLDVSGIVTRLESSEPYITLETLVQRIKEHADEDQAGAIATFTGRVRAKEAQEDTPTEYLEFEQYGEVAEAKMGQIRSELVARDGVHEVLMHHRSGVLTAGEDIVFVVVLAGHRSQAFETVKDGINRLKAEVPIFKKEVTVDEEFWVHNRP